MAKNSTSFTSETGKAGGAKSSRKGIKDKFTRDSMERINKVLDLLEETIDADIKEMESRSKVRLWYDLQEYKNPKLQRTEIKGEITTGPKKIGFEE